MVSAAPVRRAFFPLDEELGLLPGSLTPRLQEHLVRLSTWLPSFAKAAAELAYCTQVDVSRATATRLTEAAGAAAVAVQSAEVARIEREYPTPTVSPDTLLVSADGAMVPLLHGEWAEVKTLAIGEVAPARLERGERVVHTRNLSYFSRLTDSTTFGQLALGEVQRRGVEQAQRVAAVMDGAVWLQGFVDLQCPSAVRILDFPHAVGYLHAIGQTMGPAGRLLSEQQVSHLAHELKHAGPREVLELVRRVVAAHPELAELATQLSYLEKREAQLQYPQFQAMGLPIGSGSVESAHTVVVEARMNGAGMRWARENVDPMLALRNAVCNDRWMEVWEQIEAEQRRQVQTRRRCRRQQRRAVSLASPVEEEAPLTPSGVSDLVLPPPMPIRPPSSTEPGKPRRPAANHPWRRAWSPRRQLEQVLAA
jgi:hypothetical protein